MRPAVALMVFGCTGTPTQTGDTSSTPTQTGDTAPANADCADGWTFDRDVCTVDLPPAAPADCAPTHLGTPTAATGLACKNHDDCGPEQFCGAGACREALDELVTVCFEEAWFQGKTGAQDGTAPDLTAVVDDGTGLDFRPFESLYTPRAEDCCRPRWHHCEQWRLKHASGRHGLKVHEYKPLDTYHKISTTYILQFGFAPEWESPAVGRLVDQGCQLFQNDPASDPHVAVAISFWYP